MTGTGDIGTHQRRHPQHPVPAQPPCPGWAKAHLLFWVEMPPETQMWGAGCSRQHLPVVLGGLLVLRLLPNWGSLGTRWWFWRGGRAFPPHTMCPAWCQGAFREAEEGEVPWEQERVGASTSSVCAPRPASGCQVPIWGGRLAMGWARGWQKGPCSYSGVPSAARIPPTRSAEAALCCSWAIFRARPIFWL